jgi:hypothetical protein
MLVVTAVIQHLDTIDAIGATNRFAKAAEATAEAARTQANAATEANTVARELNVIARRPWIPPNLVVSAIMFAENNQADIILDFKLKNYGLTPATNVEPLITHDADWLFRQHPFDPMEYAKIQQKFCSFNRKVSVTGNTVFPGQEVPYHIDVIITADEIKKFAARTEDGEHLEVIPTIIGCVNYKFATANDIGQSGFVYRGHE